MLPAPIPARDYLTQLSAACAQSLAELPPGRCDWETARRILRRLEPYVADTALAVCEFDTD